MSTQTRLLNKYLNRFDELVSVGESLHASMYKIPGEVRSYDMLSGEVRRGPDIDVVDWQGFIEWRTSCVALVSKVTPANHPLRDNVETFQKIKNKKSYLEWGIATLRAIKTDFEKGFIGDLMIEAEAEIATDYLNQAKRLLSESESTEVEHVPAAVLAGAVLEKTLRALCDQQMPPVSSCTAKGEPKTLNPLIDDLKKAGLFNEAKAKQLRAWAAVRNHAAHGEFSEFNRTDVEQMLSGIQHFLADYFT